jgi:hypothetical protein
MKKMPVQLLGGILASLVSCSNLIPGNIGSSTKILPDQVILMEHECVTGDNLKGQKQQEQETANGYGYGQFGSYHWAAKHNLDPKSFDQVQKLYHHFSF